MERIQTEMARWSKVLIFLYVLLILGVTFTSCDVVVTCDNDVLIPSHKILENFDNTSISKRNDNYIFEIHCSKYTKQYYLKETTSGLRYEIIRDTIDEFSLPNAPKNIDVLSDKDVIYNFIEKKKLLDRANISGYTSRWVNLGVKLKLYMTSGCDLYFFNNLALYKSVDNGDFENLHQIKENCFSSCKCLDVNLAFP